MGEGMPYGSLPFPGTGCPVPDASIYYVPDKINVWDTDFTFIHLPWMFPSTDIPFWPTDWMIPNGLPLHQIYILN